MQIKEQSAKARQRLLSAKIIQHLKSRRFDAYYCEDAQEAVQKALSLIPAGDSVSWGGSITLEEIGLLERVKQGGYAVIDRDSAANAAERHELMRRALTADTFLTSFNAVSEDGVLINVDGAGNRVAAIAFGPKSVVAVVGMNKVCKSAADAALRARTYAAPLNVQRCSLSAAYKPIENTPCAITGACGNCKAEECICSHIVETRMCKPAGRIKVILVGESLGF